MKTIKIDFHIVRRGWMLRIYGIGRVTWYDICMQTTKLQIKLNLDNGISSIRQEYSLNAIGIWNCGRNEKMQLEGEKNVSLWRESNRKRLLNSSMFRSTGLHDSRGIRMRSEGQTVAGLTQKTWSIILENITTASSLPGRFNQLLCPILTTMLYSVLTTWDLVEQLLLWDWSSNKDDV